MSYSLADKLVIGVSSRTLFDMTHENEIFEKEGLETYCAYQMDHEQEPLKPGPGYELIKALLSLNRDCGDNDKVEVIVMSHNSPDISVRIFQSIAHYGLEITRAVLVSGSSLVPYLEALQVDLFLSASEDEVQNAVNNGFAAGIIYTQAIAAKVVYPFRDATQIRIAFDGDAVLFSDQSERIYKEAGLAAFDENERKYAKEPLEAGPFARFLLKLWELKKVSPDMNHRIRTALVTARHAPAHERAIRTLRSWGIQVDGAFFLGGIEKKAILKAFGAQIFFDDQRVHTDAAAQVVPAARVPYAGRIIERRKRECSIDEIPTYCTG